MRLLLRGGGKGAQEAAGVISANVNLAAETARVEYVPGEISENELKEAVVKAGYQVLEKEEAAPEVKEAREEEGLHELKIKVAVSIALSALIMAASFHGGVLSCPYHTRS